MAPPLSGAPKATLLSTSVTVMANLVGAGLLSLPYTLKRAGLITGVLAMLVMCALNATSVLIIVRCCELSGKYSYKEIGVAALGKAAATFITAIMAVYTLGSCVSFVVLIGDFLPSLVCENGCADGPAAFFGQRWVMVCIAAAATLLPLSLMRDLSSLRFTSALSFVCILYTSLMIGSRAIRGPVVPPSDLNLTGGSTGLFVSLPITMVAFTLHYNAPRYYYELAERSLPRFARVTAASFVMVLVLYQATALGGYLLFGKATEGDVLSNFADGDIPAFVARIALSCIVISCYPLCFNSLRGSVTALLPSSWQVRLLPADKRAAALRAERALQALKGGEASVVSVSGTSEEDDLSCALLSGAPQQQQHASTTPNEPAAATTATSGSSPRVVARPRIDIPNSPRNTAGGLLASLFSTVVCDLPHICLTLVLVLVSVGIGLGIPQIAVVLGYKGALGGSLIVFIFPAAMHFALVEQQARRVRNGAHSGNKKAPSSSDSVAADEDESEDATTADGGSEDAPLRKPQGQHGDGSVDDSHGGGSIWKLSTLVSTSHGLLLVFALLWGLSIMVLGTATTAGLL